MNQLENTVNSRIIDLEDTIDAHEQYFRINNFRIFAFPEDQNENTADVVRSICTEKLGTDLPPHAIDFAHRLKKTKGNHRPINVKFISRSFDKII